MKTVLLLLLMFMSQAPQEDFDLEKLRWKKRVLLIHCHDEQMLGEQLRHLSANQKGMEERHLQVFYQTSSLYHWQPSHTSPIEGHLPSRYLCSEGAQFSISLIGKDGGLKLQQNRILKPELLFNTIDAMPMRQREMQGR